MALFVAVGLGRCLALATRPQKRSWLSLDRCAERVRGCTIESSISHPGIRPECPRAEGLNGSNSLDT